MLINRTGLSPMQAARLDACLAKRFRYSDGIRTMGEDLERRHAAGELVAKKCTDGSLNWNRRRFNAMDGREQAAYEKRIKAQRLYWVDDRDGFGHSIPKTIFDALALPVADRSLVG